MITIITSKKVLKSNKKMTLSQLRKISKAYSINLTKNSSKQKPFLCSVLIIPNFTEKLPFFLIPIVITNNSTS